MSKKVLYEGKKWEGDGKAIYFLLNFPTCEMPRVAKKVKREIVQNGHLFVFHVEISKLIVFS